MYVYIDSFCICLDCVAYVWLCGLCVVVWVMCVDIGIDR